MSCDFYVKVKMRAVDARRFVREFKKEYGDRIEGARKLKTEGDALDALLGWMDGARPARLSAKDGCWRFTGDDVAVVWWVNEGFYKFFKWCVPYVDSKMARFSQQTEFGWGTYSRVKYKIVAPILTGMNTLSMTVPDDGRSLYGDTEVCHDP